MRQECANGIFIRFSSDQKKIFEYAFALPN
jgi:hypothetical protein